MRGWFLYLLLPVMAAAQQPIGEVQSGDASVRGAVTVSATGTTLMSGSHLTAGANPATLQLSRGGELKVCAGGSITITASASGREALIGLNSGMIETHYRLSSNADTVMTPDFRLLLPGPGDFHFAIGMKSGGDMCVKSLSGNSSALIVHEVFGEGTHQVRPGEGVVFQKGSVRDPVAVPGGEECGCAGSAAAKPTELGFPEQQSQRAAAAIAKGEAPLPMSPPLIGVSEDKNQVITKVDAPIVFRGEEVGKVSPGNTANPPAGQSAPAVAKPVPSEPKVVAQETHEATTPQKKVKKKWYQRFGSALANLFR